MTYDVDFDANHMDGIVNFRKLDDAVSWPDAYAQPKRGAKRLPIRSKLLFAKM
jgi:hypothetical protein